MNISYLPPVILKFHKCLQNFYSSYLLFFKGWGTYRNMWSKSWRNPPETSCPLKLIFSSASSAVRKPTIRWHFSVPSVESRVYIHIWLTKPRTLYNRFKLSGQNCELKRQTIFTLPLISTPSMARFLQQRQQRQQLYFFTPKYTRKKNL